MKQYYLRTLLASVMMLLSVCSYAYHDKIGGIYYNFNGNEATVTYRFNDSSNSSAYSGDVVIPSTVNYNGKDYRVTSIGDGAFLDCSNLTSVNIPASVTSIGSDAFDGCSSLTSVKIPASVTSIGNYVFRDCTSLKSVEIPASVTSIGSGAFYRCSSLTSVNIPASVTSIGSDAFRGCSSLTSVEIPASVTSIGESAFAYCSNLKRIDITNLDKWRTMSKGSDWAFNTSYSLYLNGEECTSITIPSTIKSINDYVFQGWGNLTNVTIPASVTSIGSSAFDGCGSLTSVNIPALVTSIGYRAFLGCSSLTSINIPAAVTYIGSWAFAGCERLTSVNIQAAITAIHDYTFAGCSSLNNINIPTSVTHIDGAAFGWCTSLTKVNIPSSVTHIEGCAFSDCTSLTSVIIPAAVTYIGSSAFQNCPFPILKMLGTTPPTIGGSTPNLGDVLYIHVPQGYGDTYRNAETWTNYKNMIIEGYEIPTVQITASATSSSLHKAIGEDNLSSTSALKIVGSINSYDIMILRNKMPALIYLDLSEADIVANGYKYYGSYSTQDNVFPAYAFNGSTTPLRKVILPNSVTSIGEYAFYERSNLKSVIFGDALQSIGSSAFHRCSGLTFLTFGDALQSIGSSAFYYCSGLTSLTFGDGLQSIGEKAFYQCSKLTSLTFGDGPQSIGDQAFYQCSKLTSLTFGDALQSIGEKAFYECSGLKSVTFGKSLKTIRESAFSSTALTEVKIPSSVTSIGGSAFYTSVLKDVYAYTVEPTTIPSNTFSTDTYKGTLYVPKTSYYNYYYNTQWGQFNNIKEVDVEFDNFHVDGDYELGKETGVVSGEPDIEINPGGGLIIDAGTDKTQKANEVSVNVSSTTSGSIITNNNITAKTFTANITVRQNLWYFITFPFDVDLKDVTCGGSYTFAQYNGSTRAANGKGGWQTVTSGRLEAGKGYIFQCNTANTLTLTVKNPKFKDTNISTTLNTYAAASTNNASWNFVGNPYPAYYGVKDLGFDAPITVWNRNKKTYEAYSVQDDDYVLSPFEAFFVQKPDATNAITFSADKRMTYKQSQEQKNAGARMRGASMEQESRKIVNLTINCGEGSDKTRIVVNKDAQVGYEMECDAAKFISNDAAVQLYTVDADNVEYAINERPMETESVALGFIAKADGAYTINASRMDIGMELYDKETATTFDLSNGDYSFTSKAGTFNSRFTLRIKDDTTGISELAKAGTEVKVTANGICINGNNADIFTTDGVNVATNAMGNVILPAGCYIVKSNGVSSKVVVK